MEGCLRDALSNRLLREGRPCSQIWPPAPEMRDHSAIIYVPMMLFLQLQSYDGGKEGLQLPNIACQKGG